MCELGCDLACLRLGFLLQRGALAFKGSERGLTCVMEVPGPQLLVSKARFPPSLPPSL